jgi:energy-converting hydrogenase Eha subunit A
MTINAKMKIATLIAILFLLSFTYSGCSYLFLELNPLAWDRVARQAFIILTFLSIVFPTSIYFIGLQIMKEKKRKRTTW